MKPQKQLFRHAPPATYGDCHRTAIAIVLDMDAADVPHFGDGGVSGNDQDFFLAETWLNARGVCSINVLFPGETPVQAILDHVAAVNERSMPVFLLSGKSRNGCNHIVVCHDGDIVCDPSIDDSGIVGPCKDGFYWVTFFGALAATNSAAKISRDAGSVRDRLDAAASLLAADLWAAGLPRNSFYITNGTGELHVYAKAERLKVMPACAYPVEWHVAEINVPAETAA
jgi:hypothetical protein